MCHRHFTRDRADEEDREDDVQVEINDDLIEPLAEEEPSEDVELLTDGSGDEDE